MTYNPSIPQPTDLLSTSQGQLLTNFTQLNTQFGVDHYPFYTGSTNGSGFHKQVTIPTPLSGTPTVTGASGEYYTRAISAITQAFFSNSTQNWQLTGLTLNAEAGGSSITTPWGIIFKWGTINATPNATVTFTNAFPSDNFIVIATASNNAAQYVSVSNKSTGGFQLHSSATNACFYLSIGN